jgi:maltooligosyltrehalose trehalohydrolase
MKVGSTYLGEGQCEFTVWAPLVDQVAVEIVAPESKLIPMQKTDWGYWHVVADHMTPETQYRYHLGGDRSFPDPASHFQPQGVHEASQVVDHQAFQWSDAQWKGIPLEDLIIYELHVGTFTPEGTFAAIESRLADLKELGINAIEIMPVAQFPGDRNWGYDGVYPYAVQNSYGGPEGLKHLVDVCHQQGFAVILDVVYNHFGPEGNYISNYGPYFTPKYRTPWGGAINFDDAHSYGVRNYIIENVLYWLEHYHLDGLRLDAIHAIYDFGAYHVLAEMADRVAELDQRLGRKHLLIAESDLNDIRVVQPRRHNGHGLDAQWCDDFHHALHTLLTGEQGGYYQDFGSCAQLAKSWTDSFVYTWTYSPDRQRFHGSDASGFPPSQFVICAQNHDQVGNRMLGERLSQLAPFDALKLAAANVLMAPAIPLLFMGEEYGEDAPFLYFISHTDPELVKAVREGRKREFEAFHLHGDPPDAQSPETFETSTLKWEKRQTGKYQVLRQFYQQLIQLRKTLPPLTHFDRASVEVNYSEADRLLSFRRWKDEKEVLGLMNFSSDPASWTDFQPKGTWQKQLDSADARWQGPGSTLPDTLTASETLTLPPLSFALYTLVAK